MEEKGLKRAVSRYGRDVKRAIKDSEKSYGVSKRVRKTGMKHWRFLKSAMPRAR